MTETKTKNQPKATAPKGAPQGWRFANAHRCGFCIDGKCKEGKCVSAIWWDQSKQLYICPCACNVGHTRCTRCGERDVEVTTTTSQCVDVEACNGTLAKKRANNPSYQALLRAREGLERPTIADRVESKPKPIPGGKCLCCGDATRGGLFLPGHDARYVSVQADAFIAADPDDKGKILDLLEVQLSPKLMAKFVARVERQSVKNDRLTKKVEDQA